MHPHLRFSNFPHKKYIYMPLCLYVFWNAFSTTAKLCAFWGDESSATMKKCMSWQHLKQFKALFSEGHIFKKRIWCCYYSHFHAYSPLVSCPRPINNSKHMISYRCFNAKCYVLEFIIEFCYAKIFFMIFDCLYLS